MGSEQVQSCRLIALRALSPEGSRYHVEISGGFCSVGFKGLLGPMNKEFRVSYLRYFWQAQSLGKGAYPKQ